MTKIATESKVVHDESLGIDRQIIAGQPIPPDLVAAYEADGGKADDAEPRPTGRVIAKETVAVDDPNLGIQRNIIEGQPVPPDLVAAYAAATGDSDAAAADDDKEDDSSAYLSKPVEDLQAEVDRRGLEVEGTGANGNVIKADLVAALEDDDEK